MFAVFADGGCDRKVLDGGFIQSESAERVLPVSGGTLSSFRVSAGVRVEVVIAVVFGISVEHLGLDHALPDDGS